MAPKFKPPVKVQLEQISVRVPKRMIAAVDASLKAGGYNQKERSLWIREAVTQLLDRPDYAELVVEDFVVPGTTEKVPVSLTPSQKSVITQAIDSIKTEEDVDVDRSEVIRTAITQRLMAERGQQLPPIPVPEQTELL